MQRDLKMGEYEANNGDVHIRYFQFVNDRCESEEFRLIASGLTFSDSNYDYPLSAYHSAPVSARINQTFAVAGGGSKSVSFSTSLGVYTSTFLTDDYHLTGFPGSFSTAQRRSCSTRTPMRSCTLPSTAGGTIPT